MIRADVRSRLTRDDAQLALRLIANGSQDKYDEAEEQLRDHGLDAILDDPRLLPALLRSRQGAHASLPLFSFLLARSALRGAGEQDATLADYLAALLLHFGLRDRATRISEVDDQTYTTLADVSADVDDANPSRAFLARAHLGNYALWISGVFPDHIEFRRRRRGGPDLEYYEEMGRTGFTLAATHRLAAEHNLATLFQAAADRFLAMRAALTSISDKVLFPNNSSPDRLLRQVRDEFRIRMTN